MAPGKYNAVWCRIKPKQEADYEIRLEKINGAYLTESEIKEWLRSDGWSGRVAPGDNQEKRTVELDIPNNAPEDVLRMQLTVKRDEKLISTQDLAFQISRAGFLKTALC